MSKKIKKKKLDFGKIALKALWIFCVAIMVLGLLTPLILGIIQFFLYK